MVGKGICMIKKWITLAVLWTGICLAVPDAVYAGGQDNLGEAAAQAGEADGGETQDKSYKAKEAGKNAQGQKIILDPLWEYNKAGKAYRLVKSKNAEGAATYFTSRDGVIQLGRLPGYYYAFNGKGDMVTGHRTVNNVRYYFTPRAKASKTDAAVAPDRTTLGMAVKDLWVRADKSWLYFNKVGQQAKGKTGLQKINGAYYHLDKNAIPSADKWIKKSNGAWWYFGKDGKYNSTKIGHRKINGSYYYLKKSGIPYKNCFRTVNNKRYYYGKTGGRASYKGWKTIDNKKYYFTGGHYLKAMPGWQKINGKWYYFGPKGKMYAKRWADLGGKRYYLKANGQMASGWSKISGTYYYFNSSGALERSTIAKKGKKYYFVTPQGTKGADILDGVGVNAAMSSGAKLQTCFNYVVRNCRYANGQTWPPRGWEPYHAYKMLTTRMGNCYDFAAAFCYLAKAVGYEGMICISGQCAAAGGGYTPHSWCELNGMVFDPEITYANGYYLFNVTYGSLPFTYIR